MSDINPHPISRERTIASERRRLTQAFRAGGLETPELDARVLIGHALEADHAELAAAPHRPLSETHLAAIAALAQRRLRREPVARIVGCKEFWGLALRLSPETLVPRPETEIVVEAALSTIPHNAPTRIADLGTGSGALLLALVHERPQARAVGTDRSFTALVAARENAIRLGLAERTEFVAGDFGSALSGRFDCIVSNPPYIATAGLAALPPEVRAHDPHLALDGGPDGLSAYRMIAKDVPRLLAPGGALVLELGVGQSDAVITIMAAERLAPAGPPRLDLAGIPRALTLRLLP